MLPKIFSDDTTANDRLWLAWLIVLVVGMLGTLLGVTFPIPPLPAITVSTPQVEIAPQGITHFTDLAVTNDVAVGDDLTVGDGLIVSGDTTVSGDVTAADYLTISAQASITVTNGAAFTPTGTYQPIAAAAEVTPTITVGSAGQLLVLVNTNTETINLADASTTMLSAAAALGQYDTLTLWCDGTNWIELSRANN